VSSEARINNFDINVVAFDGLQIATSRESASWWVNMPAEVLQAAYDFESVTLTHLTPKFVTDTTQALIQRDGDGEPYRLKLETLRRAGVTSPNAGSNIDGADGRYFEFTIHFRAQKEYHIFLNIAPGATSLTSRQRDVEEVNSYGVWPKAVGANYYGFHPAVVAADPTGGEILVGSPIIEQFEPGHPEHYQVRAANAMRIAMHHPDNPANLKIWNPNFDKGFRGYGPLAVGVNPPPLHERTNLAADIFAKEYGENYLLDLFGPTFLTEADEYYLPEWGVSHTTINQETYSNVISLGIQLQSDDLNDAYFYNKMTFTMWVEGKDGDCLNSILSDMITTTFHFLGSELSV
jgi:hypothetical protein